jgi:hypothetical protein
MTTLNLQKTCDFKERVQIQLVLGLLKKSITSECQQIPSVMTVFISKAVSTLAFVQYFLTLLRYSFCWSQSTTCIFHCANFSSRGHRWISG